MSILKIKDNISLKDLEKYGFEYHKELKLYNEYGYFKGKTEIIDDQVYQVRESASKEIDYYLPTDYINPEPYKVSATWYIHDFESSGSSAKKREISLGSTHTKYEYELYEKFVNTTLFDMINDGIVEKIE